MELNEVDEPVLLRFHLEFPAGAARTDPEWFKSHLTMSLNFFHIENEEEEDDIPNFQ